MGDEDTSETKMKQMQRRPKIIIRKCKKSSTSSVSKSSGDFKKVNGELSTENKDKIVDEVETVTTKEVKSLSKSIKRKLSKIIEDNTIVLEDDLTANKDNTSDVKDDSSSLVKKKRILAKTDKLKDINTDNTCDVPTDSAQEAEKSNLRPRVIKLTKSKKNNSAVRKKINEGDSDDDNQADSQTEYAQYLGLQPTMQFKCYRCGEKGFASMLALNMHQRGCGKAQKSNFISNLQQDTITPSDPNMLTNFRITRKVYLCSACGTYYENWNLFLHMRDVHKKHICLFCLTMFGVAEKLADHLKVTHSVLESTFKSCEEFQIAYKGSFYLICCTCENMFNERDDYFYHQCVRRDPTAKCNLCGVRCGHYYTCPNSNTPRTLPTGMNITQSAIKAQSTSLTKFTKPITKNKASEEELWMGKKGQGLTSSDNDEDYDVSHAASFCHVDISDECGERDKIGSEHNPVIVPDEPERPNTDEEQKSSESSVKKNDISVIKEDIQELEMGCEKSEIAVDSEKVTAESPQKEHKSEENVTMIEDNSMREVEKERPKADVNEDVTMNEENVQNKLCNENYIEEGKNEENDENSKEEVYVEHAILKEPPKSPIESNNHEMREIQGKVPEVEKMKTDEISKTIDNESEPPPPNDKEDSTSSDSDGERVTHPSISQDETESSSDESSDEECKKTHSKLSVEGNKNDSTCESDDSNKSELIVDEKQKNIFNENFEDEKMKSHDPILQEENSAQDSKSTASNEASNGFHLDDISEDKITENGEKERESAELDNSAKDCEPADLVQEKFQESTADEISDGILLAGEDVPAMALTLEDKLENASSQSVVKECVRTSCLNCVYCSHAIKIAVNGKQLALHLLAEHRYKPIKNNETCQDVVKKLKDSLSDLEPLFFNTDSYDSSDKSLNTSYDYTYECFQCRFVTKVHKELYVHKRKMHQKTVLLCVMCKSNFYSYSELLCHMCPGIYVSEDINFRCCLCNLDMIPSAFRLMVHLRKSHHTCDICLEVAGDQQKLSTHMWKHKLNHLCYRCGIAYRNKPDITKHLFWKHGTESVLCKKCLQKKWPHVYHFCIPPTVFICEECNASFTKAVALKVHKRLHGGELPYECCKCDQKFVSKKLLAKHEEIHNQPLPHEKSTVSRINTDNMIENESIDEPINVESIDEPGHENSVKNNSSVEVSKDNEVVPGHTPELKSKKRKKKDKERKEKPVLDVYDFPPLNLSSESDSSDEETKSVACRISKENETPVELKESEVTPEINHDKAENSISENIEPHEEYPTPAPIVDGIWDNFHFYKAELEKRESKDLSLPNILPSTSSPEISPEILPDELINNFALIDHSYCLVPGKIKPACEEIKPIVSDAAPVEELPVEVPEEIPAPRGHSSSIDHAYATLNSSNTEGDVGSAPVPEEPSPDNPPATPPGVVSSLNSHSNDKKKQKSPKKKKHNTNSSSSSDSSSDTDSSSCTCGTNCSCSSSSSNSSSSSSSDSESSTSEGRRRASARREKRKERLKHKHHKEEPAPVLEIPPPLPLEEEPVVDIPIEPIELPIRESDLDTDESSTDEDFYDKYPQSHAKQQMERNKLMLLASVAPVNNGTVSPPPAASADKPTPPPPAVKRKIKTKKRKKSQQNKKSTNKAALLHQSLPSTSVNVPNANSTPSQFSTNHQNIQTKISSPLRTPVTSLHSDATAGSGSENESARLSKRKRVRNKFYGYSSEDGEHEKPSLKWKKIDPVPIPQLSPTPGLSFQPSLTIQRPQMEPLTQGKESKHSESSGTDDEPPAKKEVSSNSSNSSSDSEHEMDSKDHVLKEQTEKSDNLYCYCQCPYDEVSEMIACDGQDCTIEWFHFECVGIMVPPKGKWYCPDCRKRRDLM